jgi:hypothetical protein
MRDRKIRREQKRKGATADGRKSCDDVIVDKGRFNERSFYDQRMTHIIVPPGIY